MPSLLVIDYQDLDFGVPCYDPIDNSKQGKVLIFGPDISYDLPEENLAVKVERFLALFLDFTDSKAESTFWYKYFKKNP